VTPLNGSECYDNQGQLLGRLSTNLSSAKYLPQIREIHTNILVSKKQGKSECI
jgi:hypothetical protein